MALEKAFFSNEGPVTDEINFLVTLCIALFVLGWEFGDDNRIYGV